jgi:hypothetical protein
MSFRAREIDGVCDAGRTFNLGLGAFRQHGGCYYGSDYPSAGAWNAAAVEQPQRVRFFYGWVVEVRAVPVIYEPRARFEPNWEPEGRNLIPVVQQYPAPTPDPRPPGYENPCPNRVCQGVEYTVILDKSTSPPDEFLQLGQHPTVIVVQGIAETQAPIPQRTRVVVRMVNNSAAEVMPAANLPLSVGGINVENALSAGRSALADDPPGDLPGINVENALSAGPMPISAQLSAPELRRWWRLDRSVARFRRRGRDILPPAGRATE